MIVTKSPHGIFSKHNTTVGLHQISHLMSPVATPISDSQKFTKWGREKTADILHIVK